jgi:hypothetical protein
MSTFYHKSILCFSFIVHPLWQWLLPNAVTQTARLSSIPSRICLHNQVQETEIMFYIGNKVTSFRKQHTFNCLNWEYNSIMKPRRKKMEIFNGRGKYEASMHSFIVWVSFSSLWQCLRRMTQDEKGLFWLMVLELPTFKVGLPLVFNPLWKCPHRHTQKYALLINPIMFNQNYPPQAYFLSTWHPSTFHWNITFHPAPKVLLSISQCKMHSVYLQDFPVF